MFESLVDPAAGGETITVTGLCLHQMFDVTVAQLTFFFRLTV